MAIASTRWIAIADFPEFRFDFYRKTDMNVDGPTIFSARKTFDWLNVIRYKRIMYARVVPNKDD